MNIFIVHENPIVAAQMLCDTHVNKMSTETAQLLCSPFENGIAPYGRTHYHGRFAKWARESKQNYEWLLVHGYALANEFEYRRGKKHAVITKGVLRWCKDNYQTYPFPSIERTPFAVIDGYDKSEPIESYRQFYWDDKREFATWIWRRECPLWWLEFMYKDAQIEMPKEFYKKRLTVRCTMTMMYMR